MAKSDRDHPLRLWLKHNKLSLREFCLKTGLAYSTLHRLVSCVGGPSLELAEEIERHTLGLVDSESLMLWHIRHRREQKKKGGKDTK